MASNETGVVKNETIEYRHIVTTED